MVAGVSYEVLQYLGKHDTPVTRVLRWPGMQLQRLTALQPTPDMVEVAIVAMKLAAGIPWSPEEQEEEKVETFTGFHEEAENAEAAPSEDATEQPEASAAETEETASAQEMRL